MMPSALLWISQNNKFFPFHGRAFTLKIYCFVKSAYRPLAAQSAGGKMTRTKTDWKVVNMLQNNAANIDCREHFQLAENAKVEIAKVRKTRHSVYNINYHLIWIPKTRMRILAKPFKDKVEETIYRVCAWNKWKAMALQIMTDHVHFFVSASPKWAPAQIVQRLKAWTSIDLREKFSIIRQTRPETNDFWASSYYCGTSGHVSAEQVARYIR
jgi:putative transposase